MHACKGDIDRTFGKVRQDYRIGTFEETVVLNYLRLKISYNSAATCQYNSARLAQSVEHETLNLRVVGSSPTLGAYIQFFFSSY